MKIPERQFTRLWIISFCFGITFLFEHNSYYELLGTEKSAAEIMKAESINTHFGFVFETICLEYMIRLARAGRFVSSKRIIIP